MIHLCRIYGRFVLCGIIDKPLLVLGRNWSMDNFLGENLAGTESKALLMSSVATTVRGAGFLGLKAFWIFFVMMVRKVVHGGRGSLEDPGDAVQSKSFQNLRWLDSREIGR